MIVLEDGPQANGPNENGVSKHSRNSSSDETDFKKHDVEAVSCDYGQRAKQRPQKPTFLWFISWTLSYLSVAFVLLLITSLIPSINTRSEFIRQIFKRGDKYDTTYLAAGNLIYYWLMNCIGYVYVNVSNMNFSRKSVMHSNHERRKDFFMTVVLAPVFYFIGNNIVLRAENDLSAAGKYYTYWDCVAYNFALWTPAYIFGLQFTHFDVEIFRGFSLSPAHMRTWRPPLKCIALIILVAILCGLAYDIYCWYEVDLIWVFFVILGVELFLFVGVTWCVRKTHFLHLHHYTVAMCGIAFMGVQQPFLTFLCAFANGVMIEGAARWGYDPIWNKRGLEYSHC